MTIVNKIFYLDNQFTKELASADDKIDSIYISGYASTTAPDRTGDVIASSAWEKGIVNYLKNPIVLAYHEHDDPCGRVTDHRIDERGLWVRARISAASEIFSLVKDEVLTAFSVGFRILDAEYKPDVDLFIIKELELVEISVVSVPMNQDTLFSLSKSFESGEEYDKFKTQFVKTGESAKGLESPSQSNGITKKEIGMDPKELEKMLADAAEKAAQRAAEAIEARQKAEADARAKAEADERALQERINKALAAVTPSTTGAETLLKEVEKRLAEEGEKTSKTIGELQNALREKSDEINAIYRSKMTFTDKNKDEVSYEDKEKAVLLSKISGKSMENTKFGKDLLTKALGAGNATDPSHLPSQTWEHEVSFRMEDEIRRRLVIAPLFRVIQMQTNVQTFPVNPEAGYGTWVANSEFGGTASPGAATTHALKEVTIYANKLATREYLNFETDEDSLIPILPIVRDAMVRRTAKSLEQAYLRGTGTNMPKGICTYDATSAVTVTGTAKATTATLALLRRDLGVWGLDPNDVVYLVSGDTYFDLMDDTNFMTMDKVGPQATLLTGQVGQVAGSPVIVCAEFHAKATGATSSATTNYGAAALARGNFLIGNQRGLRFDTQDLVETQRRVLVASLRTGMAQLSTVEGQGVSVLRWT